MTFLANVFGILAVVLFVLSYQIKIRKGLIAANAASRVFYVTQYILLGAFEGALLDIVALLVSILCQKRENGWIKRHLALVIALSYAVVIGAGLLTYQNVFSLLPILGVIFETLALWFKRERQIRLFSLAGAPPWFAYNLYCGAYGSVAGNVITFVSILVAILRYDILNRTSKKNRE